LGVDPLLHQQELEMSIAILIDTPFLSIEEYAKRTGLTVRTVRNDMEAGLIPFYQRHRKTKRLVNMVQLTQMAASHSVEVEPWNQPQEIAQIGDHQ
jgi:hypothetical protein